MPLVYRIIKGRHSPAFICDVCDEPINKDSKPGVAVYTMRHEDKEIRSTPLIVHKFTCHRAADRILEEKHNDDPLGWFDLGHMFYCLLHNTNIDLESAEKQYEALNKFD
jgi:hypothetical protein